MSTLEVTDRHRLELLRAIREHLEQASVPSAKRLRSTYNHITDEILTENEAKLKKEAQDK